jgi:hypothetical protein
VESSKDREGWNDLRERSAPTDRSAVKGATARAYRNGRRFGDAIKGTCCISHVRHIFFSFQLSKSTLICLMMPSVFYMHAGLLNGEWIGKDVEGSGRGLI